jgi:hypothetical protein
VSYGGSSLLMAMFFAGLLLNVGRRASFGPRRRELVNRIGGATRRRPRAVILVR